MKEFSYAGEGKVNGAVMMAYLAAFGPYQKRGVQVLCKHFGVAEIKGDPDAWYPLSKFLAALSEFQKQFGLEFMRKVGQAIFQNAVFPPGIDSVSKGMEMLDQAYNMNHQVEPGEIGGYHWKPDAPNAGAMVCDNPYPCSFDLGIIETIAKTFDPKAVVHHEQDKPCRRQDGEFCSYRVTWKG